MKDIFWIDKFGKEYTRAAVHDDHLMNIIGYLKHGGDGYKNFVTANVIKNIVYEARNRGLYDMAEAESVLLDITSHRNEIAEFRTNIIDKFIDYMFVGKDLNRLESEE